MMKITRVNYDQISFMQ